MTQPSFIKTPKSDEQTKHKKPVKVKCATPLSDPLLDVNDLIAAKVVGSRDGVHAAMKKGWIPEPIRWPNGRMFWRLSVIEDAVAKIEAESCK